MKNMIKISVFILLILLISCQEEETELIWNSDPDGNPPPVLKKVEPAQGAFAGIQIITITGENFSPEIDKNMLTVNGELGTILEASENSIKAIPPLVIGDSLSLRLDVVGSYFSGEFKPYNLLSPANPYGNFKDDELVQDLEFDKDGNLYALVITPSGKKVIYKQAQNDTIKIEYGRISFPVGLPSMKFGPDGALYICRKNNKKFYRIPPEGGNAKQFARLPGRVQTFDFDADGNIYIGGTSKQIYRIKPDATIQTVANYDTIAIVALRIYQDYVYVVGEYEEQTPEGLNIIQKIWRNKINSSSDTLAEKELYFDWYDYNQFNKITGITFSEDGDLYVSSDADNPITIIRKDKTTFTFLEGILPSPAIGLIWDENDFIYYINEVTVPKTKKQIIRVYTGKRGAIYNGRR